MKGKDPKLSEILSLSGVTISLLAILYGLLTKVTKLNEVGVSIKPGLDSFLLNAILAFMFILLLYLVGLIILFFIKLNYRSRNSEMSEEVRKFKNYLIDYIYYGPVSIIKVISLSLVAYLALFSAYMLEGGYLMFFLTAIGLFLLVQSLHTIFQSKSNKLFTILRTVFLLPLLFLSVYVLINLSLLLTSDVIIILDKSHYNVSNDVFVNIYPKGILLPSIESVYYSNTNILLENRTDSPFKSSPAYVIINSSILKDEPYNSFLFVRYSYGKSLVMLPKPKLDTKLIYIPVYNMTTNNIKLLIDNSSVSNRTN